MNCVLLIPAYNPEKTLIDVVKSVGTDNFQATVVVNDGSDEKFDDIFRQLKEQTDVEVIEHKTNFGKGAALKTGMDYVMKKYPNSIGIVTADADGQHDPQDIIRVGKELSENQSYMIIGSRKFGGEVPLRSKFGNIVTSMLMSIFAGISLTDTQTGLRGIPSRLLPSIVLSTWNRYEFEMDMLFITKKKGFKTKELEIKTIYSDGNESSHFNPIVDSMRIYFVLFRYIFASFMTAIVDYLIFIASIRLFQSVFIATCMARSVAVFFNFFLVKKMVFDDRNKFLSTFPKYILLVTISGFISLSIIHYLGFFKIGVIYAKIIAESVLYIANFLVQRDIIFRVKQDK